MGTSTWERPLGAWVRRRTRRSDCLKLWGFSWWWGHDDVSVAVGFDALVEVASSGSARNFSQVLRLKSVCSCEGSVGSPVPYQGEFSRGVAFLRQEKSPLPDRAMGFGIWRAVLLARSPHTRKSGLEARAHFSICTFRIEELTPTSSDLKGSPDILPVVIESCCFCERASPG